jgi:hypothetical protein
LFFIQHDCFVVYNKKFNSRDLGVMQMAEKQNIIIRFYMPKICINYVL